MLGAMGGGGAGNCVGCRRRLAVVMVGVVMAVMAVSRARGQGGHIAAMSRKRSGRRVGLGVLGAVRELLRGGEA